MDGERSKLAALSLPLLHLGFKFLQFPLRAPATVPRQGLCRARGIPPGRSSKEITRHVPVSRKREAVPCVALFLAPEEDLVERLVAKRKAKDRSAHGAVAVAAL